MSVDAVDDLQRGLQQVLYNFDIPNQQIGNTQAIIKSVEEVKKVFEGYASASAPQERAYRAALNFLLGKEITEDEYDFITAAINTIIKEQGGKRVIDSENFSKLLSYYQHQIAKGNMWRLSWYWLFLSYFSIDIENINNESLKGNINYLRNFLYKTHAKFTEDQDFLPEWAKILNEHKNILSENPCDRYAEAYLYGKQDEINKIKENFKISRRSWFWHQLTLSVVRHATSLKQDYTFKSQIPSLIDFLEKHHGYRDEAIKLILERYYKCTDKSANSLLRDYTIRPDIWKNPKLRNTGIASKWHHVNESVWRMVFGWVTREHLRMFFEIISGRHGAMKDRFSFWSQYIEQITYTKLIFGSTTQMQQRKNPEIKKLFDEEDGVYSLLNSANRDLDAFIIQINNHVFVEFSMNGNAAFIYENNNMPFSLNDRRMNDNTFGNGLKSSQHNKIIHNGDWQFSTKRRLMQMGILPDNNQNKW
jgi:hypothetical protein